jgi:lipopolysaccharide exporter
MKKNALKTGSHALLAGFAQQGFALIHFLLAVRTLQPTDLGVWAMLLTLTSFVEMARLGLVQNALVHFCAHYPTDRPTIRTTALWLSLAVSVLGVLAIGCLAFLLRGVWQMPELPQLIALYAPLAVLNALLRFADGLKMLDNDFRTALWSAFSFGLAYVVGTVIWQFTQGFLSPFVLLCLQIPSAFCAFVVVWRLGFGRVEWGRASWIWSKRLFQYGRFGLGTNLCSLIFQRADMLLLGGFVAPAALAAYNVATRLIGYLDFPLNYLGLALFPRLAAESQAAGTEGVVRLYEKAVGWLSALTFPITIGAILGASVLIKIVAGDRFEASVFLFQLLALSGFVKPFGRVLGVTLDAVGKPEWNFKLLVVSMCLNLSLNAVLIPFWGIVGAAVATSGSVVLTTLIGQFLLRRWLPVRSNRSWQHMNGAYQMVWEQLMKRANVLR